MTWWPANEDEVQAARTKEYEYVREVLDFGWHNTRSPGFCGRLEAAFAERYGVEFAISHSNGTATMHSCLIAAGVGPGDEVIIPSLTMASTAYVVLHQNAVPVFADVDAATFEIDAASVARLITPRTKAIIVVALYGMAPDMDAIMALAREHGIVVIEDNAQCYLGEHKGRLVGAIGDMASFSFQGSKHITCGDGGITITDDEGLAERIRKGAILGYSSLSARPGKTTVPKQIRQAPSFERHQSLGWNYRLPEICAAAALGQLERIDDLVSWRRAVAKGYGDAIAGCDWLRAQAVPEGVTHSYWCYTVLLDTEAITWHQFRDKIVECGGEPVYGAWRPVHLEPAFREERFYGKGCPNHCPLYEGKPQVYGEGLCPVTERLQPRLFQFRTNYTRDRAERQFEAVSRAIASFDGKA
jgi:perosamine synthetase